jgi:hypothetical protein
LLFNCLSSVAQENNPVSTYEADYRTFYNKLNNNQLVTQFTGGATIEIGAHNYGALRLFAAIGLLKDILPRTLNTNATIGYQLEIELYRGGLGASYLDKGNSKWQLEMRNQIALAGGWANTNIHFGSPYFALIGDNRSTMYNPYEYSLGVSTIFINGLTHKRNQQIGAFMVNARMFNFSYYNDFMWDFLPVVDNYDRYWTGGGQVGFYFKNDYGFITDFALRFDNYTGYEPNLYETCTLLKVDNIPYSDLKQQSLNKARWQWKVGIQNNTQVNLNVYESNFDVQNWIHYRVTKSTFHPRSLKLHYTVGANYQYNTLIQ